MGPGAFQYYHHMNVPALVIPATAPSSPWLPPASLDQLSPPADPSAHLQTAAAQHVHPHSYPYPQTQNQLHLHVQEHQRVGASSALQRQQLQQLFKDQEHGHGIVGGPAADPSHSLSTSPPGTDGPIVRAAGEDSSLTTTATGTAARPSSSHMAPPAVATMIPGDQAHHSSWIQASTHAGARPLSSQNSTAASDPALVPPRRGNPASYAASRSAPFPHDHQLQQQHHQHANSTQYLAAPAQPGAQVAQPASGWYMAPPSVPDSSTTGMAGRGAASGLPAFSGSVAIPVDSTGMAGSTLPSWALAEPVGLPPHGLPPPPLPPPPPMPPQMPPGDLLDPSAYASSGAWPGLLDPGDLGDAGFGGIGENSLLTANEQAYFDMFLNLMASGGTGSPGGMGGADAGDIGAASPGPLGEPSAESALSPSAPPSANILTAGTGSKLVQPLSPTDADAWTPAPASALASRASPVEAATATTYGPLRASPVPIPSASGASLANRNVHGLQVNVPPPEFVGIEGLRSAPLPCMIGSQPSAFSGYDPTSATARTVSATTADSLASSAFLGMASSAPSDSGLAPPRHALLPPDAQRLHHAPGAPSATAPQYGGAGVLHPPTSPPPPPAPQQMHQLYAITPGGIVPVHIPASAVAAALAAAAPGGLETGTLQLQLLAHPPPPQPLPPLSAGPPSATYPPDVQLLAQQGGNVDVQMGEPLRAHHVEDARKKGRSRTRSTPANYPGTDADVPVALSRRMTVHAPVASFAPAGFALPEEAERADDRVHGVGAGEMDTRQSRPPSPGPADGVDLIDDGGLRAYSAASASAAVKTESGATTPPPASEAVSNPAAPRSAAPSAPASARKRKSRESHDPAKRATHIESEKKRRHTIRQGFQLLVELVPALRATAEALATEKPLPTSATAAGGGEAGEAAGGDDPDGDAVLGGHTVSKATILLKSVEFIRALERKVAAASAEVASLETRAGILPGAPPVFAAGAAAHAAPSHFSNPRAHPPPPAALSGACQGGPWGGPAGERPVAGPPESPTGAGSTGGGESLSAGALGGVHGRGSSERSSASVIVGNGFGGSRLSSPGAPVARIF